MINRDRIDIISQILEAANGGASKTRIMQKALLTSAQLKEILTALSGKDLIRYDENARILRTTEQGLRFLQIYNQIGNIIKEEQHTHNTKCGLTDMRSDRVGHYLAIIGAILVTVGIAVVPALG
jgi:predicted transcriptional regulator